MLVEATTVDTLVSNLKAKSCRSSEEIRQTSEFPHFKRFEVLIVILLVAASLSEDDDIVAGPQKLSLKCPVCDQAIV